MISILIPTYNYNIVNLVLELINQCNYCTVRYEIIVIDDASNNNQILLENNKLKDIPTVQYINLEQNIGRSAIRNRLAKIAKYETLLFLDADTFPSNSNFIKNYIKELNKNNYMIIYGGIKYTNTPPDYNKRLRWLFGKKREETDLKIRLKRPYKHTLTSNLMIKRALFNFISFNETIREYGFEDLVFIKNCKDHGYKINHIENPVYHLGIDNSILFIKKHHSSLKNLKFLIEQKIISYEDTSISKLYLQLSYLKLDYLLYNLHLLYHKILIKILISKKPSLHIFDLYRLGYFCKLFYSDTDQDVNNLD
ncbi:glycosyltransferase family 2 protein [Flavobacterium oreochromis]|uniref:Glycosyltransferase 2-like domain-containing protein n=3 Tax=Flavobacterium TaxID=237 RepID=A0A246G9K0_9FLAO|nr:glycosyltransferase family 2 protein [Flavobacterium oreochromis]OWP74670.1 hypothetical protein BWG23_13305 [Flavobacterium oreochromis]OWP76303.1 hypothetical protein BWK62_09955 [Flavobacterium oreochromis]